MVEAEADCLSLIRQVKALQGALDKVTQLILQEHLVTCLRASLWSADPEKQEKAMVQVADLLAMSLPG
jgi:DNA-binding FrmR family transcriptional regulator